MQPGREDISGVQADEGSVDEAPEVQDQEVDSGSDDTNDGRRETARETVERVFKEAAENAPDGDPSAEAKDKAPAETDEVAEKPQKQKKDQREFDPELRPPERFGVEEKELYNTLPKGMKRALNRTVKNLEAQTTRTLQDAHGRIREVDDIEQAVKPFVTKWAKLGRTRGQAIAEIAACQDRLTDDREDVREDEIVFLVNSCEINKQRLAAKLGLGGTQSAQGGTQVANIENHPTVQALRAEISSMRNAVAPVVSNHQRHAQQYEQQVVNTATSEMLAVKDEKDQASGRYRYPDLHDEAFIDRVKPLVSGLIGNVPDISYGEALKRAYVAAGGRIVGASSQPQTGLPAPHSTNTQNRSLSAAASLRGKTGPSASMSDEVAPPAAALKNPRASVEWALANARRGR